MKTKTCKHLVYYVVLLSFFISLLFVLANDVVLSITSKGNFNNYLLFMM